MKKSGSSSYAGSVIVIYQALQSYGVDADAVIKKVGLDLSSLSDVNARVAEETYDALILHAIEATGAPSFGLRFADYVHPTTFHALGLALLSSETLRDFCERFVRYFSLINTNEKVDLIETEKSASLSDSRAPSNANPAVERAHEDAFLAVCVKFIRMMYRPDYCPLRVESIWPPPEKNLDAYQRYFGVEVNFNAEVNAITIDQRDLDIPLPSANAILARQNDQVVVDFLAKFSKVDLPSQVNLKLIEFLPSGDCSKEKVAKALNMSARALHNKLEKSETSYQELLDSTRQQLAEQYMRQQELSVSEVAYLLGFTDSSNFSRAFKRWSGMSPSAYRHKKTSNN